MPIYVYSRIDDEGRWFGERFEIYQSMKDAALILHPEDGTPVGRVPSNVAIQIEPSKPRTISDLAHSNAEKMFKEGDPRVTAGPGKRKKLDPSKMTKRQIEKYIETGKY